MVWLGEYQWGCLPGKRGGVWDRSAAFNVLVAAKSSFDGKNDDATSVPFACDYAFCDCNGGRYYEFDAEEFGASDGA